MASEVYNQITNTSVTHIWNNGCVTSAELVYDDDGGQLVGLRIQDAEENIICDLTLGEQEAISVAHALLGIVMRRIEGTNGQPR
jgi:hypothetical protein